MAEKYKTCKHSTGEYGQTTAYVHPSCPRLTMIKGNLVSSKRRCKECRSWERRKMIPKCSECENAKFQDMNGRPNRWYCVHSEARERVSCPADTMICKTERYSTEITIKTSPKWCPRRIKNGKK